MKDILKKIGLTLSEAKTYEALSKVGQAQVSKLSDITGIYRTNLYDILEQLKNKGLVSSIIKNKKKIFSLTQPSNLLLLLENKKKELADLESGVSDIISNIKIDIPQNEKNRVFVYQDKEGLSYFYESLVSIAKTKDEVLIIGSSETILEVFNYYFLNLSKLIKEIHVKGRMIANKGIVENPIMKGIIKITNLNLKFISKTYLSPVAFFIFRENIGYCNFQKNPFVIIIEDKNIAELYRNYFENLWVIAKR